MRMIVDHISYTYKENKKPTIQDVSFEIKEKEILTIIGQTGSGKSTLIQQMNGLLRPDTGTIYYHGKDVFDKDYHLRDLRSKVGLVFQYPEYQLFESDVFSDVCFGPKNQGMSKKQAELKAFAALRMVGVPEELFYVSPFELSGGQKRRVAIAGVLAMEPEILILDELAAGLDPQGRKELLSMLVKLKEEKNMSIVLVSHSMDDVAEYADRVMVLRDGKIAYLDTPKNAFLHKEELEAMGLSVPQITHLMYSVRAAGGMVDVNCHTIAEAKEEILKLYGRG